MKTNFLLFFTLFIISYVNSYSQENILVSKFLNIVKSDDINRIEESLKFLDVKDDSSMIKNEIVFYLDNIKTELSEENYSILSYKNFKNNNNFKEYQLRYENLENVYCIINEKGLITFIILNEKNDKIISFYTSLIKHEHSIFPIILSEVRQF